MNHDDVLQHISSFPDFQGVRLGEINRRLLKKWLIWMAAKRVAHKKKDGTLIEGNLLSGRRINSILQGMRVAVRWAVDNEELAGDPFRKLDEATEEEREKGILTQTELNKLIVAPVDDPVFRLSVLLAARCGMRRGEVRGLKWGDINFKDDLIIIQHNYVNEDGLKSAKIKGGTLVKNILPVPLPSDVKIVLELVRHYSNNTADTDFIIQSRIHEREVVSREYFRSALRRELQGIGIDETAQKKRNITFHSLRHTFVTLGRMSGLNDFEIQTLARHKSKGVMERYSHGKQAIDFVEARKKLEAPVNGENGELRQKTGTANPSAGDRRLSIS
jgi:integrase